MKVIVFTRYNRKGASSRLRFIQFFPYLQNTGIEIKHYHLLSNKYLDADYSDNFFLKYYEVFKSYMKRFFQLFSIFTNDVFWIEKELYPNLPGFFEMVLYLMGKKVVYDYDDAIFHNYDMSTNLFNRLLKYKIYNIFKRSTVVVCGSRYIECIAQKYNSSEVLFIPTVVDKDRYSISINNSNSPLIIGWIGTKYTIKYITSIAPALITASKLINFKLYIVGAHLEIEGVDIECFDWTEDSEASLITRFDIGVMPLEDNLWEKGKCGYKLIQYMACGIPVITSPVGVNPEIIGTDKCGILASSIDDWVFSIVKLANNPKLRVSLGLCGRKFVENEYSLQIQADKLVGLFKSLKKE